MEKMKPKKHNLTRAMEIHAAVELASEAIVYYYPVSTFVHHNPLHGFEHLSFEEALRQGAELFGSCEYLPEDKCLELLEAGKINKELLYHHLKDALERKGIYGSVTLGNKNLSILQIVKSRFERKTRLNGPCPDPDFTKALSSRLSPLSPAKTIDDMAGDLADETSLKLAKSMTISAWCDESLLDTEEYSLVETINTELIKYFESFFDEGHSRWRMPYKDRGLFGAWRRIASRGLNRHGIPDLGRKIMSLPHRPEECIADCLESLGIPEEMTRNYITLHLASLPGWAGLIKWRENHAEYEWQKAYPAHLVDFVAIRLWYEKELAGIVCKKHLGIGVNIEEIKKYMRENPLAYFFRREHFSRRTPDVFSDKIADIALNGANAEDFKLTFGAEYSKAATSIIEHDKIKLIAKHFGIIAEHQGIDKAALLNSDEKALRTAANWTSALSDSEAGIIWLKSLEASYSRELTKKLKANIERNSGAVSVNRPLSQSVYCIDVRSESFRRHLESTGDHATYGFAGFFAAFIKYRAHGSTHDTDQFPVVMNARNKVKEVPRANQEDSVYKRKTRRKLGKTGYNILHDLKEDIITPYVMVESLGWFYAAPILGKTWATKLYKKISNWASKLWLPQIRTAVTVDRLSKEEAHGILSFNQHAVIRRALKERFASRGMNAPHSFIEYLRLRAMNEAPPAHSAGSHAKLFTENELNAFVSELQRKYDIEVRHAAATIGRIMQHGFTFEEQVFTVETILRATGLVSNFARLVLLCGHGSTTENNPFEAALDCGACGGNGGAPNARVAASLANKPEVRAALKQKGIDIPDDTRFIPGQHNTTTDEIALFDLEDLPATHTEDLERLRTDLLNAGKLNSRERCRKLPDINKELSPEDAWNAVSVRCADGSQVRPEWGLSGNAAFIIGRRYITKDLNLEGRAFLHSYDYNVDKDCKALEVIMTAPQVVAQWINMEHFFSTVDNDVFGSGSKIYHNITGRNAIMYGTQSDLRAGLPLQTVMNGDKPFHEPMRLISVIEAPKDEIKKIIDRHHILQNFYDKEWVYLISIDPSTKEFHCYVANKGWEPC